MELFLIVFLFGIISADDCINYDLRRIDSIHPEPDCSSAGGMCVLAADCRRRKLAEERGLCPQQQKDGVECCYAFSIKETRCKKFGGDCRPQEEGPCNPMFIPKQATDCDKNSVCCIAV